MGNKMEDKVPIGEFSGQSLQFCAVIEIFCSFVGGNLSGKSSAMIAEGKRTNFILNFRGFTTENLVHETITVPDRSNLTGNALPERLGNAKRNA